MTDAAIRGRVSRYNSETLETTPGSEIVTRSSKFGDLGVLPLMTGQLGAGYSGAYYTGCNPTPGTAIATTTSITAFTAISPVICMYNSDIASTGRDIILDFLSMRIVQVPTSATEWEFAWVTDQTDRWTSGGTLVAPTNVNTRIANQSINRYRFGAIVAPAASGNVRIHSRGLVRDQIPVILDTTTFRFGSDSEGGSFAPSTGNIHQGITLPPLVIGPGHSALLYLWGTSNGAAPTWEFTTGWLEI